MSALSLALPFPPASTGRPQVSAHWCLTRDGDPQAVELFARHYSCRHPERKFLGGNQSRFAGQGRPIVLIGVDGRSLFVWRKEEWRLDQQDGVCCAVFRNEGQVLSSVLIREAMRIAWARWPAERLFTFVDAEKTAKRRGQRHEPGWCFLCAGWERCGESGKGLVILEARP